MTPDGMQRAFELFEQAIRRPPVEQSAYLIETCGDDAELRAEIESLLDFDSRVESDFMRPPGPGQTATASAAADDSGALIGASVGAFRVKQVIAAGGMGTVYEAVQDQPHRVVALKVMKRDVASRSALRRFQFEAQILGRMRHPNIAQIYQAGMHDDGFGGVPYFAMEYVPGAKPITQYAKDKELRTTDRLRLFAKICEAVHHGHEKGVVHRDLKPANILVDSVGEPKVIDFGVARATDSDMSITTQQTCVGQLVGSVQYMSPEQCDADPHDLDARSDVYALGVVLYELLTGVLPYETPSTTIYAATRAIKEQTPRRPSSINQRLRKDVETITLKALEKDRDRRYQSAAELSADIHRYLKGEPIAARPQRTWTRAARWVTRHPAVTSAMACLGVGAIVVAVVVSTTAHERPPRSVKPAQMKFFIDPFERYNDGGPPATLLNDSGDVIKRWPEEARVRFAALVERPEALGGGQLVPLGFSRSAADSLAGSLCAFDPEQGYTEPIWKRRVETEDVLPELRTLRGATGDEFRVAFGGVYDVFPEKEFPRHPGPEIVVCFRRTYYSQSIIRIYDLNGQLLYQAWHDGLPRACHWMSDARLLVFAGTCDWPHYDVQGNLLGDKLRDFSAFALRPEPGAIFDQFLDYLSCDSGDDRLDPAWYLRLEPDNAPDVVEMVTIRSPASNPGRTAQFVARLSQLSGEYIVVTIDEHGEEIPTQRIVSEGYKRNQNLNGDNPHRVDLPDPGAFKLVPMTMADVMPGSAYSCPDTASSHP